MDPIIGGSLISAGSSLLGGLFGGNSGPTAGDTRRHTVAGIMGQAQGAREASEAWGFNPLTLLGASSAIYPSASGGGSQMGQAIANAGLAIADGMTEASAQKAYLSKLEEQNAELRKALDGQTLRPKVPGIYGRPTPAAGVAGQTEVEPAPPANVTPLLNTYTHAGASVTLPEGPDADEMVSGLALKEYLEEKAKFQRQFAGRAADEGRRYVEHRMSRLDARVGALPLSEGGTNMPSRKPWWMDTDATAKAKYEAKKAEKARRKAASDTVDRLEAPYKATWW